MIFIILSQFEKSTSYIFQVTTKVLYGCKRGLDGRITDCKLAMHDKCHDELRKVDDGVTSVGKRRNESVSNISMMSLLMEQKYVVTKA